MQISRCFYTCLLTFVAIHLVCQIYLLASYFSLNLNITTWNLGSILFLLIEMRLLFGQVLVRFQHPQFHKLNLSCILVFFIIAPLFAAIIIAGDETIIVDFDLTRLLHSIQKNPSIICPLLYFVIAIFITIALFSFMILLACTLTAILIFKCFIEVVKYLCCGQVKDKDNSPLLHSPLTV
jgi:hypothetical protein